MTAPASWGLSREAVTLFPARGPPPPAPPGRPRAIGAIDQEWVAAKNKPSRVRDEGGQACSGKVVCQNLQP
jgi:hypothetical protein